MRELGAKRRGRCSLTSSIGPANAVRRRLRYLTKHPLRRHFDASPLGNRTVNSIRKTLVKASEKARGKLVDKYSRAVPGVAKVRDEAR